MKFDTYSKEIRNWLRIHFKIRDFLREIWFRKCNMFDIQNVIWQNRRRKCLTHKKIICSFAVYYEKMFLDRNFICVKMLKHIFSNCRRWNTILQIYAFKQSNIKIKIFLTPENRVLAIQLKTLLIEPIVFMQFSSKFTPFGIFTKR